MPSVTGDKPLISVLIPCFNAEKYIGETLESVLQQTWRNLEIIVVDDGSTDGSAAEVRRHARHNLRLIQRGNGGAAASRNVAFQASRGDFVQYLDADDLISRRKLEVQVNRLLGARDCVASAAWARFRSTPSEAVFASEDVWRDLAPLDWLLGSNLRMLFPALWLIPRDLALRAGPWDERLTLMDDTEFFVRLLLHAREVLFCGDAQAYYRSGITGSLSGLHTPSAWISALRANASCEELVLKHEDSARARRMFAVLWQSFAHAAYPYDPALADRADVRARSLDPSARFDPGGGLASRVARAMLGWRLTRRLQVATGRT